MSENILETPHVVVTRYVGPTRPDGKTRTCFQINAPSLASGIWQFVELPIGVAEDVALAILEEIRRAD